MEPVTHLLTGGCLARAGFNRTAAYATMTMVIAAELPDIDTLWSLRGPIEGFQHHRGITHTFLGLPVEAALLVAAVYGWHQWKLHRAQSRPIPARASSATHTEHRRATPTNAAPVRWGVLYGLAIIALLSHLLLDYTNNYGLRPFFPFNDRWYAASIVFIFDPAIFALLVGALTLPWLFGLIGSEVGAKKRAFPAKGWAIAALLGVAAWWGLRATEHAQALQMAMAQSISSPAPAVPLPATPPDKPAPMPSYLQAQRALASPDPISPFRWSAAIDFGPLYQLAEIDTTGAGTLTLGETTYPKPGRSPAVLAAEGSKLGRVYMDWSPMPILDVTRPDSTLAGEADSIAKVVTFRDPRFMGGWMQDAGRTVLEGTVGLNAHNQVVRQSMDGRVER